MTTFLQQLRLTRITFTPVEQQLLEAVTAALDPASARQARAQIASINHVQRLLDWTEVNFYRKRWGRLRLSNENAFPNAGEFALARLAYRVDGLAFASTLWCAGGRLFSLVTRPSIEPHCFGTLTDLALTLAGEPQRAGYERLALDALLPPSYLAFCADAANHNASATHRWRVVLPAHAHLVHLPDDDFVFLAERRRREFLLARASAPDEHIYHSKGERAHAIGTDFASALAK